MSNQPLITKYRPADLDEVFGHDEVLGALSRALDGGTTPHAYLFTGAAGLGKTTLARIVAKRLECEVMEIDAASNNGIDAMRELVEMGNHMSLTGNGRRMFLIDECHALSTAAWQALLKILEEPPEYLYFALCTTNLQKVPETISSRCFHSALRGLAPDVMEELLSAIAEAEGWKVDDDVMSAVIEAATGQPRKGLSFLQAVHDAPSKEEVRRIINIMAEGDALFDLCQLIISKKPWATVQKTMLRIDPSDFERARVQVGRYLVGCIEKAKSQEEAQRAWTMLDALLFPTDGFDAKATFYAAIGRVMWGGNA